MPVKLRIDVKGDAPEELKKLAERSENLTPAWDQVGAYMLRSIQKNFRAGGRPTPWTPLSIATLTRVGVKGAKRGRGPQHLRIARAIINKKILIDTGGLMNSITYEALPGGDGVEIGSNLPHARIHQLGGQAGRGRKVTIPMRPYLLVQAEDEPRITNIVGNWIVEGKPSA